ncbi:MAG: ATP-binding protein [Burkholderiales bacterium]
MRVRELGGGQLVTLIVIFAIDSLTRSGLLAIQNPVAVVLIAVVYSGYSGGVLAGLISALLTLLYGLYYFDTPDAGLYLSPDDSARFTILAITAPLLAVMTGVLKERAGRALRAQLASERAHSARVRLITDAVPVMIAYIDAGQRFRFCNRQYSETMGRAEADVVGRTVREVMGEEQFEAARPWLERALAGERVEFERPQRLSDGRDADLQVTYVPEKAMDGQTSGVYALVIDLTERKRAERIKERFIAMVSHELRSPLTSILWTLEELADRPQTEEDAKSVRVAQHNAGRMLRLADDILDVERIDQGELRLVAADLSLGDLVARAIEMHAALAEKQAIRLEADSREDLQVHADPDRLQQVLANFISNAMKHSPSDSAIRLAVERRGAAARVSVADCGKGVPEAFRERLFGRFSQGADSKRLGGTGLGLAICKEIMEHSGGSIGYEPHTGGGSVFWFELPLAG